ncbi:hypothetical protein BDP55DRAFT_161 [Colletotrichum godetiae]|uniref:Secreted protein n=1 Tax=Colletotrichum godetiae TaxID=1209918 RepID=A0AAJ0B1P1_9PEZI|nr:uncharacterized protein BDP55DRAFT_161 [Colletotrichum godetiae]KAK1700810.1 hypothetical protein BDP55DRAFT_161 [Colletotrichum godetiae]
MLGAQLSSFAWFAWPASVGLDAVWLAQFAILPRHGRSTRKSHTHTHTHAHTRAETEGREPSQKAKQKKKRKDSAPPSPTVSIVHPVPFGVVSVAVKRHDTILARDCPDGSWQRSMR